jgi:hypothetical protein
MHLCTRQCTRFLACHRRALSIRILSEHFVDSAKVGTVRGFISRKERGCYTLQAGNTFSSRLYAMRSVRTAKEKETLDRFTPHNT